MFSICDVTSHVIQIGTKTVQIQYIDIMIIWYPQKCDKFSIYHNTCTTEDFVSRLCLEELLKYFIINFRVVNYFIVKNKNITINVNALTICLSP